MGTRVSLWVYSKTGVNLAVFRMCAAVNMSEDVERDLISDIIITNADDKAVS